MEPLSSGPDERKRVAPGAAKHNTALVHQFTPFPGFQLQNSVARRMASTRARSMRATSRRINAGVEGR